VQTYVYMNRQLIVGKLLQCCYKQLNFGLKVIYFFSKVKVGFISYFSLG